MILALVRRLLRFELRRAEHSIDGPYDHRASLRIDAVRASAGSALVTPAAEYLQQEPMQ